MKRGRPNIRRAMHEQILELLTRLKTPVTISVISKEISKTLNKTISWNTIQKYVNELVESGRLHPLQLQHSKIESKPGLVVYSLKK